MTERGDQLNDCRLRSLRASGYLGPYPDMWREHLQSMVGTEIRSITDLEYAWLGSEGFTGHLENRWFGYLRSLNYTGALNDMLLQFWCDDGGGPVFGFKALRAWVWIDDRFILIVKLSDDWAAGNVNTGVTIVSDVNGSSTVNGIHIGDEIEYEMDWEAAEGEVITITFSGSEIENGDGDLLEDTVLVALNESDDTPPQLVSATIPADGNFVNVVFDEEVHSVGAIYHVGWSLDVTAGGTPRTIGTDSSSGSGATWSFHLDDQVKLDETLNIDYDSGPGNIWDLQFNYMASLTNDPVTNNSTQSEVPTDPPELTGQVVENATPSQVDLTFSEPVLGTVAGWDVTIGGVSVTGLALVGASDTRQLTFTEVITIEDVVRVIYVESSGNMEDTAGLPLPDYDELVTNNVNPVWESDIPDFLWPIDVSITPYDVSQHTNGTSHTYTLVANSWPTGISMSSAGVVSGTPTIEQTNNGLVVRATAGAGFTDSTPFNAVASAIPALTGYVVELATPSQVDLTFSEPVLGTVAGWDVTIDTVSVTGLALVGSTDTRQLTFNETVYDTHAVRVIYVEVSGDMQDTASLPLPDYDVLATNNAGPAPPSVVYELNATFHRYGPAGPLVLAENDIMAASDDPAFGSSVAEIDKGAMQRTGTAGTATLQNESLFADQNGGWQITLGELEANGGTDAAPGMCMETILENTSTAGVAMYLRANTGGRQARIRIHTGYLEIETNGNFVHTTITRTWPVTTKCQSVLGGYTGDVPDPAGLDGSLYIIDDKPQYGSGKDSQWINNAIYSKVEQPSGLNGWTIHAVQRYVDASLLATPARSLFASDHASIADYTPDDGVSWAVASGAASTSGGNLVNGGAVSLLTLAEYGRGMFEHSLTSGVGGTLFRYADTLNYWAADVDASDGSGDINEYNAGTPTSRGGISGTGGGRKVLTDDGENIVHISANNLEDADTVVVSSTAGATSQVAGLKLAANAVVAWECIR